MRGIYMWEKIKSFFQNKIVKIVEVVVMTLASAGLIIGGVSTDTQAQIPALVSGILMTIETLISFIQAITTKKNK